MTQALLRVQGLTGGYGDVQVLWGLDLEVARGEIVCLVGSNGAGKTTLMRTLSGLIPARAGHIQFNDVDLSYANPERALRAGLAHVPEGRRLFSAMSVRDNLLMGAYLRDDGVGAIHADRDSLVEIHRFRAVCVDRDRLVVVDRLRPVVLHVHRLVVIDRLRPIVAHPVRLVVLDLDVLVLLRVDPHLLRALLVLEADGVRVRR